MAQTAQEKEWEVEDAARTLMRAEEIKQDPELYKKVQAKLREQRKSLDKALGSFSLEKTKGGKYKARKQ